MISLLFVSDKKAACAAVGGFLKRRELESLLECEIQCCTGDNCNNKFPSQSSKGESKTQFYTDVCACKAKASTQVN